MEKNIGPSMDQKYGREKNKWLNFNLFSLWDKARSELFYSKPDISTWNSRKSTHIKDKTEIEKWLSNYCNLYSNRVENYTLISFDNLVK